MKICARCKEAHNENEFLKKKNGKLQSYCVDCRKAKAKIYREINHEEYKIYNKEWRENNPEKYKKAQTQYWYKNKERLYAYCQQWKKDNYCEAQRLKNNEYCANRRAKLKGLKNTMPKNYMQVLIAFYGNKCMNPSCIKELNRDNPLTHDHVIPVTVEGSTHSLENSQLLCKSCNSEKRNKTSADYRNGNIILTDFLDASLF